MLFLGPMPIRFRDFELDEDLYVLRRSGRPVRLRPKVFDLLAHLVRHRARVVRRDELIEAVWGHTAVGPGSLSGLVNELRHVLGESAGDSTSIRTVHARGYQFVAPVAPASAPAAPPASSPSVSLAAASRPAPSESQITECDLAERERIGGARRWLGRVSEVGACGLIAVSRAEGERAETGRDVRPELPALRAAATEQGLDVVRVSAPGAPRDGAGRFLAAVIRALLVTRGSQVVGRGLPLPTRAWLEDAANRPVAGGLAPRSDPPPGGFGALASLLSAAARTRPVVLVVDDVAGSDLRFVRGLARLVEQLADAPVLCVAPVFESEIRSPSIETLEASDRFSRLVGWGDAARGERAEIDFSGSPVPPTDSPLRAALVETLARFGAGEDEDLAALLDRLCENVASARGAPSRPRLRRVEPDGGRRGDRSERAG